MKIQHTEQVGPNEYRTWDIKDVITVSPIIKIVELYDYGRALIIEDKLQSVEADHHIIHEMSTHPVLTTHLPIKDVLIMGGGEGAMAQECLKYDKVENVVNVDISKGVTEACRKYMPSMNSEAYADHRFQMVNADAWKDPALLFNWDFIICNVQICGNTEDKSFLTITEPQVKRIKDSLTSYGVFTTAAYTTFYDDQRQVIKEMIELFSKYFKHIILSHVMVPSYGCETIIFYCSDVDLSTKFRIRETPPPHLKTYTHNFFKASTVFPPHLIIPELSKYFGE